MKKGIEMIVLFGFLSGILGGMGVGGGAILIPALTLILGYQQKTAQIINLLYFIPTAVSALTGHVKNKRIETGVLRPVILWGILGCAAGAFTAIKLNNAVLKKMFGIFLAVMGAREIITGIKTRDDS